jgi:hypothetical protein
MNKYVFPGADASCSLGWVVTQLESAGFEVKNVDVLGVHYSATLYRWYKNWLGNKDKVLGKYGEKWFRTWNYFLASATIASRQGSASVFQITLHKNLNAYHRIKGVKNHASIHVKLDKEPSYVFLPSVFLLSFLIADFALFLAVLSSRRRWSPLAISTDEFL